MPCQLSKINHDNSDTIFFFFFIYSCIYLFIYSFILFFIYLFIYLLSKSHYGNRYSKTTKARNLKFGWMMSLYMNLRPSNFKGTTSRGSGHMHPKLVTAKFIKGF